LSRQLLTVTGNPEPAEGTTDQIRKGTDNLGEVDVPAESAYGLHLVRVLARTQPRIPDFDELRDRLSTDYSFETRQAANAQALERLTERYEIVFDGSWTPPSAELARASSGGTRP
jgi:hypothetical protein